MAKPIIAVDIDGVLANWVESALPRLNKILGTDKTVNDDVSFELNKCFGVSPARMNRALSEMYKTFSVKEVAPIDGSQEAIELLSRYFEVIALTARPKVFWNDTRAWIDKYFHNEIDLHLGTGAGKPFGGEDHEADKSTICKSLKARYLIEDNPAEIMQCLESETTPVCYAWPWNTHISEYPDIKRGNWIEIVEYILDNEKISR